MLIRFEGFNTAPKRDHIVVQVATAHILVELGGTLECEEEHAYRLLATKEWSKVEGEEPLKAEAPKHHKQATGKFQPSPASENRAILDGEVK